MAIEDRIAFYMDEHVPRVVSEGLRRRGVDVFTAKEAGMLGASDEEHLALARRETRTVVTQDADFLRLHSAGRLHRGIVYTPQGTPVGTIVQNLMIIYAVLRPGEMVDHVEFI